MSEQLVLDGMPEPIIKVRAEPRSARRRLTDRQRTMLANGIHPATKLRLLESDEPKRCKDCAHLAAHGDSTRTYYKCGLVMHSFGMATDIRLKWSACTKFEQADEKA